MRVDLDSLLWRTRGREWDYGFVLRPVRPRIEAWYDFHVRVFSGVHPARGSTTHGGVLLLDDEEVRFVATAFQDKAVKDFVGRPVAHYLIWFAGLPRGTTEIEAPAAWGIHVVHAFGDAWTNAVASVVGAEQEILSEARGKIGAIEIPAGESVAVRFDQRIVAKKKVRKASQATAAHTAGPGAGRGGLPLADLAPQQVATRTLDDERSRDKKLRRAILEGEASALGLSGWVETPNVFWKKLRGGYPDLMARLAKSFGGAPTDQFVRSRAANIARRVALAHIDPPIRRGFDALVDALRPLLAGKAPPWNDEIARLIGASPEDLTVRNLAARLAALLGCE